MRETPDTLTSLLTPFAGWQEARAWATREIRKGHPPERLCALKAIQATGHPPDAQWLFRALARAQAPRR